MEKGLSRSPALCLCECSCGVLGDLSYVMAQLGHEDPKVTLSSYAKVIATKTDHGAALAGLVGGSDWAPMGTNADPMEVDA